MTLWKLLSGGMRRRFLKRSFPFSLTRTFPFSTPGYYELTGPPASGKTTVALLLAVSKLYSGRTIFVTTQEEYSPAVTEMITGQAVPNWFVTLAKVKEFFELVGLMQPGQLLVLDSLTTLRPDHPGRTEIASSVNRHWVKPPCPVLVINQERWPVSVGGTLWRSLLCGQFVLMKHRDRPFLMSELRSMGLWLTWMDGSPVLRLLSREEEELWTTRGVIYDGFC